MDIELRPYQTECINRILTAYEQDKHGTELLVLPTGSGKTVIFSQVIHKLSQMYGINAMVIAHRDELLTQAADKYRMVKPDAIIGKIGGGIHEYGGEVTVASVATISRPEHLKRLKAFGYGLIITDEGHHSQAESYQKVYEALPDAFHLMVTATSDRLDGKPLIDKEPIFSASIIDMVADGYLCDLRAIAIRTHVNLDDLHTQAGDYKVDELETVIDTPERNKRIADAYLEHCSGRQALCFSVTVAHAWNLNQAFLDAGVASAVVSGQTPQDERAKILSDYEKGRIQIVCNCAVLTEGYDAPQTSCIIMARPTQSRALYVQSIGRGTRLSPGKTDCIILDITDNCLKHRLEPQSLSKALNKYLKDEESLTEAEKREKSEALAGTKVRTTKDSKRSQDITINILERLDWQKRDNGMFVLEIGSQKHRIALVPCNEEEWCDGKPVPQAKSTPPLFDNNTNYKCSKCNFQTPYKSEAWNEWIERGNHLTNGEEYQDMWGGIGYYSVWARLAPFFEPQMWVQSAPLDWAQQLAEKKARMLLSDAKNITLVDKNAAWRFAIASEKQIEMLTRFGVKFHEDITKGEASDILDPIFEKLKAKKATKEKVS